MQRAVNKKLKVKKKELILSASQDTFAKIGFKAATMRKIAETAGIAVGTIYIYFKNKDAILRELLNHHNLEHEKLFESMSFLEPAQAVKFFYKDRFKNLSKLNNTISMFMFEVSQDKKLRDIIYKKIFESINEHMKSFLKNAVEKRIFKNIDDIEAASFLILAVLSSIVNWKECAFPKQLKHITYDRFTGAITDLIINGLAFKDIETER